jgi:hypothetical protein
VIEAGKKEFEPIEIALKRLKGSQIMIAKHLNEVCFRILFYYFKNNN